ncbi:MAG TPA: DUF4013 domain-containing protein [Thermoanaerobaculia bacterium]|nr:DUF4013 domain-containing protein [Thermoanaerobaculia bacterium]
MTEGTYTPPPAAPPPPPPPASGTTSQYDFVRPFAFVFQDPNWVTKVLIGGLFYIAAFLIIGIFFLTGYCARLARNVINGEAQPLPDWSDLGGFFAEGLRIVGVVILYILPFIAIVSVVVIPAALLGSSDNHVFEQLSGGMFAGVWCLMFPLGLMLSFWIPGALLMCVAEERFSAAFDFARIWTFIRGNIGNYLLAYVIYLVARFAAPLGLLLFCVGIIFTVFWSMLVATYAFAQTYRLSRTTAVVPR